MQHQKNDLNLMRETEKAAGKQMAAGIAEYALLYPTATIEPRVFSVSRLHWRKMNTTDNPPRMGYIACDQYVKFTLTCDLVSKNRWWELEVAGSGLLADLNIRHAVLSPYGWFDGIVGAFELVELYRSAASDAILSREPNKVSAILDAISLADCFSDHPRTVDRIRRLSDSYRAGAQDALLNQDEGIERAGDTPIDERSVYRIMREVLSLSPSKQAELFADKLDLDERK